MHGWTTFFWAWWIAWSPFVGLFIARVSRGRTVRELIACMLIMPTLVAALWMNAFGGTAVSQYVDGGYPDVIAAVQAQQPEIALFALLDTLPLAPVISVLGLVLIVVFFVTSLRLRIAGHRHHHRRRQAGHAGAPARVWCIFEGLVALRCCSAAASWPRRRPPSPPAFPLRWCWSPVLQHLEGAAREHGGPSQLIRSVAIWSMRCTRYEALAGGGGRELLNRARPPVRALRRARSAPGTGPRARRLQDIESDTGYDTRPDTGRRPRRCIANGRLRYMLIGYARVSKADGSQVIVKLFAARGRLR